MSHPLNGSKNKGLPIYLGFFLILFPALNVPNVIRVQTGNEVFIENFPPELQDKRLGLVINHTALLPDGTPLVNAFLERGIKVKAIFSPEHGFSGAEEAGRSVKNSSLKSIKIFSLYGDTKKPTLDQMKEIDVFVYDIQDVGTRFYTYITTLKYVLEAAAAAQKSVYVLDRPNPIGGRIVEGPRLQPEYQSFIGCCPIPVRYGLTVGELALMMQGEGWVPAEVDLHIIKMKNWKRAHFWKDTGLTWVPTSPNIPHAGTATIYPGIGLLGAFAFNVGLGTLNPFLQFGAPWLDPEIFFQAVKEEKNQTIELTPINFTPVSIPGKVNEPSYENQLCRGIQIRSIKEENFFSIKFALLLLKILKENYPEDFVIKNAGSLNLMFGNNNLVRYMENKVSYKELIRSMEEDEAYFRGQRKKYLLYD
jgi:uncharacterized protein YbbC (DUF1343 family)